MSRVEFRPAYVERCSCQYVVLVTTVLPETLLNASLDLQ